MAADIAKQLGVADADVHNVADTPAGDCLLYTSIAAERAQDFGYDDGIDRFFGIVGAGCEARCEEGRGEN